MSSMIKKTSEWLSKLGVSIASLIKVVLLSKSTRKALARSDKEVVVLGNGPSLNQTISEHRKFLMTRDRLAVNFAANAPVFFELCPTAYVLADPHFFNGVATDPNVVRLWDNLRSVTWEMTLFLPVSQRKFAKNLDLKSNVNVCYYNLTPVEGFRGLSKLLYRLGLGMPRPRNVLIPSIMLAINEGYGKVYVAGADHSWTQTLWVDDQNRVVSIQPHFYEDNESERKRVATEYHRYPLHQILQSLYIAFRSYFDIADYAQDRGVEVINITPESFIDAFPRLNLSKKESRI